MKVAIRFAAWIIVLAFSVTSFAQAPSRSGIGAGAGQGNSHAVIKSKPEPEWPEKVKTDGKFTIVLRAIFGSDGKVRDIKVFEVRPKEPEGLTKKELEEFSRRAVEAAREIKFVPGTKDGRPVSWRMQLEYTFDPDKIRESKL